MRPSETTISNYISQLHDANAIIQNSLLIGEQVCMINDVAHHYNQLRELVTPAYLTDEEWKWCKSIANGWNEITREYNRQMDGTMTPDMQDNMDDLQDALRHLLDDLRDMGVDEGPEGPVVS